MKTIQPWNSYQLFVPAKKKNLAAEDEKKAQHEKTIAIE